MKFIASCGHMGQHPVPVLELDPEHGIGQGLDDGSLHLDRVFLGHPILTTYAPGSTRVRISGPFSVMAMVSSK